jgi:tetratricopeptide (TPR) repeat protein
MNGAPLSDLEEMTIDELWTELESSDGFRKGQVLITLHNHKYETEEFGLALAYASEAAEVFRASEDYREVGMAEVLMGNCHHGLKQYKDAINCYVQAGTSALSYATDHDLALIQENMANSLQADDQLEPALESYIAAEALFLSVEMKLEAGRCATEAGDINFQLGRNYSALAAYRRVRDLVTGCGDLSKVAEAEANIAEAYMALGEYDHAVIHAREALNMAKTCPCPKCVNRAMLRLGKALRLSGQLESSKQYIQKSFDSCHELSQAGGQGISLVELGNLNMESDPDGARDYFEQARSIFDGLDWVVFRDRAVAGLAALDANAGDHGSAIEKLEGVVKRAEAGERIGFANKSRITLAQYHLDNSDPYRALSTINAMTDTGEEMQATTLSQLIIKSKAYMEIRNWDEALTAADAGLEMIIPGVTGAIEGVFHHVKGECLRHKDPVTAQREYAKAISFYISGGDLEQAEKLANEHFVEPTKLVYELGVYDSARNESC